MNFLVLESPPDSRGWTSTVCLCEDCARDPEKRKRCGVETVMRIERVDPSKEPRCNQCPAGRDAD